MAVEVFYEMSEHARQTTGNHVPKDCHLHLESSLEETRI
jgi:hypothetical protein